MRISVTRKRYKDTGGEYTALRLNYGGHEHEFELLPAQRDELIDKLAESKSAVIV